jgi:hypothetical protein
VAVLVVVRLGAIGVALRAAVLAAVAPGLSGLVLIAVIRIVRAGAGSLLILRRPRLARFVGRDLSSRIAGREAFRLVLAEDRRLRLRIDRLDRACLGLVLRFARHLVAGAAGPGCLAAAAAAAVRGALLVALGIAFVAGLLFEKRLPVGNRDLVVVGVDFAEG